MLTVIARLKVKADRAAAFEDEVRKMVAHVEANEPGTLVYACHRATADPTVYVFYEVYSEQAAFAVHGGSSPMKAFFAAMGGIVDGRPTIEMFEEIAAAKR